MRTTTHKRKIFEKPWKRVILSLNISEIWNNFFLTLTKLCLLNNGPKHFVGETKKSVTTKKWNFTTHPVFSKRPLIKRLTSFDNVEMYKSRRDDYRNIFVTFVAFQNPLGFLGKVMCSSSGLLSSFWNTKTCEYMKNHVCENM